MSNECVNTCHSSLIEAAKEGCTECVKFLIPYESGQRDDNWGRTALMYAAERGHLECVKLLIDKEVKLRSNSGMTALMYAAQCNNTECLNLLISHEAGLQNNHGDTALKHAVLRNHVESAKLLLSQEAALQDSNGMSALMWAAEKGYPECVDLLMPHEVFLQDNNGMTALMWAAKKGYPEFVELSMDEKNHLKEKYAERFMNKIFSLQDKWTYGFCMPATKKGNSKSAKPFIGSHDDNDIYTSNSGHLECVKLLIDKEACFKDNNGKTALDYAKNDEIRKLIQDYLEKNVTIYEPTTDKLREIAYI